MQNSLVIGVSNLDVFNTELCVLAPKIGRCILRVPTVMENH